MAEARIGTSGYQYRHWRRLFYPKEVAPKRWLPFFAKVFDTCELNNTFYRLPPSDAVSRWRAQTPDDFVFACKGSRFITHLKRLLDPREALRRYFERVDHLEEKLGPILWQLPPQMNRVDLPRLETFLKALPRALRHAFEFRDTAWYSEETCDLLDEYGVAFCEHDLLARPAPRVTGGFRYLRFHGATGKYRGRYGKRALRKTAASVVASVRAGDDVFVYFNNDIAGHAIRDALDLRDNAAELSPVEAMRVGARSRAELRHHH